MPHVVDTAMLNTSTTQRRAPFAVPESLAVDVAAAWGREQDRRVDPHGHCVQGAISARPRGSGGSPEASTSEAWPRISSEARSPLHKRRQSGRTDTGKTATALGWVQARSQRSAYDEDARASLPGPGCRSSRLSKGQPYASAAPTHLGERRNNTEELPQCFTVWPPHMNRLTQLRQLTGSRVTCCLHKKRGLKTLRGNGHGESVRGRLGSRRRGTRACPTLGPRPCPGFPLKGSSLTPVCRPVISQRKEVSWTTSETVGSV